MIKHIVLWTLTEDAKKDSDKLIHDLKERFNSLLGTVDGLAKIEVAYNYNGGNFDLVLYCEFASREAQDKYQTHPAHVAIKEIIHTITCDRNCVDYEI